MKKFSPNAIVVAVLGLVIACYIGIAHHSVPGFIGMLVVTIGGAYFVNALKG